MSNQPTTRCSATQQPTATMDNLASRARLTKRQGAISTKLRTGRLSNGPAKAFDGNDNERPHVNYHELMCNCNLEPGQAHTRKYTKLKKMRDQCCVPVVLDQKMDVFFPLVLGTSSTLNTVNNESSPTILAPDLWSLAIHLMPVLVACMAPDIREQIPSSWLITCTSCDRQPYNKKKSSQ